MGRSIGKRRVKSTSRALVLAIDPNARMKAEDERQQAAIAKAAGDAPPRRKRRKS